MAKEAPASLKVPLDQIKDARAVRAAEKPASDKPTARRKSPSAPAAPAFDPLKAGYHRIK